MCKPELEESLVEIMTLTQQLNELILSMQLKRIQESSKDKKVNDHE